MRFINLAQIAVFFILMLSSVHFASAQFGIAGGTPHITVPAGGKYSSFVTLINYDYNDSITFDVILPAFHADTSNVSVSPTLVATPMVGTIPPRTDMRVNLTAYLPYFNTKEGNTWSGIIQFVEVSSSATAGGASIHSGLAKYVFVIAAKPAIPFYYFVIAGIAACAIVVGSVLVFRNHRKKRQVMKPSKRAAAIARPKKVVVARSRVRKTRRKARPTARRRTARKRTAKSRRGARTSTRRRSRR